MGKRTTTYEPRPRDYYPTPFEAVEPLTGFLSHGFSFCEPCAGDGRLVSHLETLFDAKCFFACDVEPKVHWATQADANNLTEEAVEWCEYIITNPPFTWSVLQPMMDVWIELRPTILLLPADFMHNKRMAPYLLQCSWIKSIGRVKWIEDSAGSGVDNYAWYRFDKNKEVDEISARFYGRDE